MNTVNAGRELKVNSCKHSSFNARSQLKVDRKSVPTVFLFLLTVVCLLSNCNLTCHVLFFMPDCWKKICLQATLYTQHCLACVLAALKNQHAVGYSKII